MLLRKSQERRRPDAVSTYVGLDTASTNINGNAESSWGAWGRQSELQSVETETSDSAVGLKAAGDLIIAGGTIKIDSSDDSIHSNGNITVAGGTINLIASDDGNNSAGGSTYMTGTLSGASTTVGTAGTMGGGRWK